MVFELLIFIYICCCANAEQIHRFIGFPHAGNPSFRNSMAEVDTAEILREVVERESQFKTTAVNKPIDVDLDIGSLLAVDTNPVNEKKLR